MILFILRLFLLPVLLFCSCSSANAVTLVWDANSEPDLAGYKIHFGIQPRVYSSIVDVGNVSQATINIPIGSYISATAYDTDGNESDYSNEIFYAENTGHTGATRLIVSQWSIPTASGMRLGVDYEMVELPNGDILYIFKHLVPGQRVKLER